jgi:hypothetical protein
MSVMTSSWVGPAEIPFVPVPHPQEQVAVLVPSPRFLPELGRLDGGHDQLQGPGAIHFLADDSLDLSEHPEAQRHPREEPRCETPDQAGAKHQLVADDFRLCRRIP